MGKVIASAMTDIVTGLGMPVVWVALASEDINDQHRRTRLGPAWLLINYLAFAGTFVLIFGHNSAVPNFAAFVAIGLFVWLYISEVITLSVSLFTREESFIKGTTLPLTVYVMRMTVQSLIRAGYALAGCVAIMFMVGTPMNIGWLWSVFALLILALASPPTITLIAIGGAFFPDSQFIVQNLMRVGMFLTPIFWVDMGNGLRGLLYRWNPFTYFLEIVRAPILTGAPPVHALALCGAMTVALWLGAILFLGLYRKQIVFVL